MTPQILISKVTLAFLLVASLLLGALLAYTILWVGGTSRSVINDVSPTSRYLY